MTVLAAGLLDFRAAVFSDGWIAGLLGLWGDGLILCIKAHRSEDVSFYFATLYMLRSPAYF